MIEKAAPVLCQACGQEAIGKEPGWTGTLCARCDSIAEYAPDTGMPSCDHGSIVKAVAARIRFVKAVLEAKKEYSI